MSRTKIQGMTAVLVLVSCLILSGCADLRRWTGKDLPSGKDLPAEKDPPVENGPDAGRILLECRSMTALPQKEREQLYHKLRADFERYETPETRFALVCLALRPHGTSQDRSWARKLLRDYLQQANPREDLAALAGLLETLIDQRLLTEQQLAAERKRAETLAGKLKALEDIERIIRQREEGGFSAP